LKKKIIMPSGKNIALLLSGSGFSEKFIDESDLPFKLANLDSPLSVINTLSGALMEQGIQDVATRDNIKSQILKLVLSPKDFLELQKSGCCKAIREGDALIKL